MAGLKVTRFMTRELNSPAFFCHKPSHFLHLFDTSAIPHPRFSGLTIRQITTSEFGAQTPPGVTSKIELLQELQLGCSKAMGL